MKQLGQAVIAGVSMAGNQKEPDDGRRNRRKPKDDKRMQRGATLDPFEGVTKKDATGDILDGLDE